MKTLSKFIIWGELADLNTYIKAERGNKFSASKLKKAETEKVYWELRVRGVKPITAYPIIVSFRWYSRDNRKDVDNVSFSKKFILDGMVMAKVIEDDSRKFVSGLEDHFSIDADNPRIEIEIKTL